MGGGNLIIIFLSIKLICIVSFHLLDFEYWLLNMISVFFDLKNIIPSPFLERLEDLILMSPNKYLNKFIL